MDLRRWAAEQAEHLLSPLGNRWRHAHGVAERATEVGEILREADRSVLVVAAWLHDIGYAPRLRRTGLHQLDGAAYLLRSHVPARMVHLVAHHSEARFEVRLRGFGHELDRYEREESFTSDALTYCDLTTGPTGQRMTFQERVAEVEGRYGEGDVVRALHQAKPYLAAAVARTEERLARAGLF